MGGHFFKTGVVLLAVVTMFWGAAPRVLGQSVPDKDAQRGLVSKHLIQYENKDIKHLPSGLILPIHIGGAMLRLPGRFYDMSGEDYGISYSQKGRLVSVYETISPDYNGAAHFQSAKNSIENRWPDARKLVDEKRFLPGMRGQSHAAVYLAKDDVVASENGQVISGVVVAKHGDWVSKFRFSYALSVNMKARIEAGRDLSAPTLPDGFMPLYLEPVDDIFLGIMWPQ